MKQTKSKIMKVISLLFAATLFFISCNKENSLNNTLSSADLSATQNMNAELNLMQQSLDNLISSTNQNQRSQWDNSYHQHDSIFWSHHTNYNHSTYTHDDHSHNWVPYESGINHQNHFHHQYPAHANDSLVTTQNNHHHSNTDHHHQGHDFNHHQLLDSLHRIHLHHHP